jgi:hypothetical protein
MRRAAAAGIERQWRRCSGVVGGAGVAAASLLDFSRSVARLKRREERVRLNQLTQGHNSPRKIEIDEKYFRNGKKTESGIPANTHVLRVAFGESYLEDGIIAKPVFMSGTYAIFSRGRGSGMGYHAPRARE